MTNLTRLIFFTTFIFIVFFFAATIFFSQVTAQNAGWFYPMTRYHERQTVKGFNQLIDDRFYFGKEKLFPHNRFYGYHAAVDLEYFSDEADADIPVHAVATGQIVYIGTLKGYGGVILQRIHNTHTALYGHVDISNLQHSVGDVLTAGEQVTVLGDEFSAETSKERKHLHFGIYKGTELYFHGHENSMARVIEKWEDPNAFLEEREAVSPVSPTTNEGSGIKNEYGAPSEPAQSKSTGNVTNPKAFWGLKEILLRFLQKLGIYL